MKYTFLFSLLVFLGLSCTQTPVEQEMDAARQLCEDITYFIYQKEYEADKCDILDFIKEEVATNFKTKTYYASVELIKGTPVSAVPCPEKIMQKDPALAGRFKPLRERTFNDNYNILYYIEHDEKVDSDERKIRVKVADRGERYAITVDILLNTENDK